MDLKKLHDVLFNILLTVNDICDKNEIRWFLDSGSELGAVRHNGFIPWDDDADICIFYKDLAAFADTMRRELPEHMHIWTPDELAPGFYDYVPRIYDDRYPWKEQPDRTEPGYEQFNYVNIDVFLIAGEPEDERRRSAYIFKLKTLYGLSLAHRSFLYGDKLPYTPIQKLEMAVLGSAGKLIPQSKLAAARDKLIRAADAEDSPLCAKVNYTLRHLGDVYRREWYDGAALMNFESAVFPVPKGYDAELTAVYGDYMTPVQDSAEFITHTE